MFQAVSKLLFVSILLLHCQAFAEQTTAFWVLGSYAKADNAHREQDRLSKQLGLGVEVRFDEKLGVFRLLAASVLVSREQLDGMPAWRINLSSPTADQADIKPEQTDTALIEPTNPLAAAQLEAVPPAPAPSPEKITTEAATFAEPSPLFAEFQQNESLTQYCLRLPKERLCQHPRIERALAADRKLLNHRSRMSDICQKISDPDRKKTCEQLH